MNHKGKPINNNFIFNEWIKFIKIITDESENIDNLKCPHCDCNSIDFQYVGDEMMRVGYLDVWCKSCLHGIHISRTRVPEQANMISFNDPEQEISKRIPNFKKITP